MTVKRPTSSSVVLSWMPVAAMVVVAAADVVAGPGVGFLPLASLGPAFAGLLGGWRRTALIGAVALVLCVGLGLYDGLFQERRGFSAMASVAGVTGAGIAAAVMRGRREAELASVRSIAEVAQRVLLRPVPRTAGPLQAAVSYTSAVAEARIGGDLYEVVASPHGVRVIVGDVQGKGLTAVETAAVVLGAFREAARDEPDLVVLGERLERSVARELEGEKLVTAVLAEIARTARSSSSTTAIRRRWSYAGTGPWTFRNHPLMRFRWAWARTGSRGPSLIGWPSPLASNCSCTRTASPRPVTRPARSTPLVSGRTCSRPPTHTVPWRPCART